MDTPRACRAAHGYTVVSMETPLALPHARDRFEHARARYGEARDDLRLSVLAAMDAGMSEAEAARQAGVSRMTVRAWKVEPPGGAPTNV
jgi:alkanesulfonate monooxygenase SsuD/methylene tetrahydromethanopterin reductase-like flavin-dependent oxidoreductase (luciferase family)